MPPFEGAIDQRGQLTPQASAGPYLPITTYLTPASSANAARARPAESPEGRTTKTSQEDAHRLPRRTPERQPKA